MLKTKLDEKNITVTQFKSKYSRLFKKIISYYGGRKNIHDLHASIHLYLSKISPPVCEICGKPLVITKKMRHKTVTRCKAHVNLKNLVRKSDIIAKAKELEVEIINDLAEYPAGSHQIDLYSEEDGYYTQSIGYFLSGGISQSRYNKTRKPRITQEDWVNRCTKAHDAYYDYSKSKFLGVDNSVRIICPVHGEFEQNAGVHQRGHGCPQCGKKINHLALKKSTDEFIDKSNIIHNNFYDYSNTVYTSSRDKLTILCPIHGEFEQVAYYHTAGNGCPRCGFEKCNTNFQSKAEIEIYEWLKSVKSDLVILQNDRTFGKEIDIFLPEENIGIEFNGLYWHSSNNRVDDKRCRYQHKDKSEFFSKKGIQILQIMENEWNDELKKSVWKSTILHKLGKTPVTIGARKCNIIQVNNKIASDFFCKNHLQGYARSHKTFALEYNKQIIAMISAAHARFQRSNDKIEIIRYATKNFYHVPGGFSKLLNRIKKEYPGFDIVSYANLRWSTGDLYEKTQFKFARQTDPCYYYTDTKSVWHRSYFQKHKLPSRLDNFDPNATEVDNMYNHGYRRYWDCGNIKYEYKN